MRSFIIMHVSIDCDLSMRVIRTSQYVRLYTGIHLLWQLFVDGACTGTSDWSTVDMVVAMTALTMPVALGYWWYCDGALAIVSLHDLALVFIIS